MKILWVSNSPIGPSAKILDEAYKGSSGGWIQSEYEYLDKSKVEMSFLCFLPSVKKNQVLIKSNELGIVYAVKPPKIQYGVKPSNKLIKQIENIIDEIKPDIIQIWGTETCLSNAVSKCAKNIPKVIFMQGMLGIHKKYLGGYFSKKQYPKYFKGVSLKSKLKSYLRKKLFIAQAEIEKQTINNCNNVIIDSNFAKAYCSYVAPSVKCYMHMLTPNAVFENYRWNYESKKEHQIFTVFGSSSEKGVQQLLFAVSALKGKYPDIKVVIPGNYNLDKNGKLCPSKHNGYEKILSNIIKINGLQDNVCFTGRLTPEQMAENISKSHVFVNPSCMEVHALSLREAMSMGVPSITSLCGSTGEYVKHNQNGLIYRYEEQEALALYIDKLFTSKELCEKFSAKAVNASREFKPENDLPLIDIYSAILAKE